MQEEMSLGQFVSYLIYGIGFLYLILALCQSENLKETFWSPYIKEKYLKALIVAVIFYFLFCMSKQLPAWFLIWMFLIGYDDVS